MLTTFSQQAAIWNNVRQAMKDNFHFKFEDSWAQTVSGYYEALFGWITVNYLLGNFVGEFSKTNRRLMLTYQRS